jgi:hypothetical protein
MITNLIANQINFSKNKGYSARMYSNYEVKVTFNLALPMWCNDSELITQPNHSILYATNKKKNIPRHYVTFFNKDEAYPEVSNNKFLQISRIYDINDWIKSGENYLITLTIDRANVFREIESNIILKKIGDLTGQWDRLTSGKFKNPDPTCNINYGASKFSSKYYEGVVAELDCDKVVDPSELVEQVIF